MRDFLNHRRNDISYDEALQRAARLKRVIKDSAMNSKVLEYLTELTEALQIGKRDNCICGIFTIDPLDYLTWVHRHNELTAAIEAYRPK